MSSLSGVEALRVGLFRQKINTSVNLFRIGRTVIDTGPCNQWSTVRPWLVKHKIERVILTHHHEDHSGNGYNIQNSEDLKHIEILAPEKTCRLVEKGYPIQFYRRVVWGMPKLFSPNREVAASTEVIGENPVIHLKTIPVPGHAEDMVNYMIPERGWLFAGDLFVTASPSFIRPEEDLQADMDSLRRVLKEDWQTLFCAHRGVIQDGKQALQKRLDHFESLHAHAIDLRARGLSTAEITKILLGRETFFSFVSSFHFSKRTLIEKLIDL